MNPTMLLPYHIIIKQLNDHFAIAISKYVSP